MATANTLKIAREKLDAARKNGSLLTQMLTAEEVLKASSDKLTETDNAIRQLTKRREAEAATVKEDEAVAAGLRKQVEAKLKSA